MSQSAPVHLMVMGVAGCGKSSLAGVLSGALQVPLIEGDDHHPPENRDKMARGVALDDGDRQPWLKQLGDLMAGSSSGAVLTCSALKRRYRDVLRLAVPALHIVFMDIPAPEARRRVASRVGHLFPASLVDSQFDALESPVSEAGVMRLDAMLPMASQLEQVLAWLQPAPGNYPSTNDGAY